METKKTLNLVPGVDWVGILDFGIVTFDVVMETKYGTTYNSYLVRGKDKVALIETAKVTFWEEYIAKIRSLIDPAKIDYIVMDHTEPDHAGALEKLLEVAPNAQVIASGSALRYLADITNKTFASQAVKDGDHLDLGGKTLKFISAPNLHWPDSMYTYLEEDKILFTCDSFGAHYAHEAMFDDLVGDYSDAFEYYYHAILRPFSKFFVKAIEKIEPLEIAMIAPGHGPILRKHWKDIVAKSKQMSMDYLKYPMANRVAVAYVSAYGYTESLAVKIAEGLRSEGMDVDMCNVEKMTVAQLESSFEKASGYLFGSSTINQNALPPIYNCFAVITSLRDRGKLAAAFGSYGWSGEARQVIENNIQSARLELAMESLFVKFKPSEADLQKAFAMGVEFARKMQAR